MQYRINMGEGLVSPDTTGYRLHELARIVGK